MSEQYVPSPTTPSPARKLPIVGILIGAGVALLALVAVAGTLAYTFIFQRPNAIPQLLAADTQLYMAFTPNLSDVPNLERLRRAFPTEDDAPVDEGLNEQLEELLGVTFEADIAPWVGNEIAVAASKLPFDAVFNPEALAEGDLPAASDVLLVLASRDDRAAEAFLAKQRAHREGEGTQFTSSEVAGVTIVSAEEDGDNPFVAFALVRRHVVFATSPELIAAMAQRDPRGVETLEQNPRFREVRDALPAARLGYVFLDGAPIAQAIEASGATLSESLGEMSAQLEEQLETAAALKGVGLSLAAEPNGFAFDSVVSINSALLPDATLAQIEEYREAVDPERVAAISSEALAALSFRIPASFGEQLMESMASVPDAEAQLASFEESFGFNLQDDLLSWFHGEATLVLLPGETVLDTELPVTGYFALRPTDRQAAEAGVERLVAALDELAGGELGMREEEHGGVAWQVAGSPEESAAGYAFVDDNFVLGVGPSALAAVAGADARLGDQQAFDEATTALPAPNGGMFYVAVPAVLDLLEAQGMDAEDLDGLRPFQAIAAASSPGLDEKGLARSRLFISVAPEE